MIAKAVRGRPPEPARKLQVCRPAAAPGTASAVNELRCAAGRWNCIRSRTAGRSLHAHAGGRAEPVPAGAAAGGAGRRGAGGVERDMVGFCLSRRGKIATADVMGCDWCDWCDAPGRTGALLPRP